MISATVDSSNSIDRLLRYFTHYYKFPSLANASGTLIIVVYGRLVSYRITNNILFFCNFLEQDTIYYSAPFCILLITLHVYSQLESTLLGKPMDQVTEKANTIDQRVEELEKTYKLTEKQLWDLLSSVLKNITNSKESAVVNLPLPQPEAFPVTTPVTSVPVSGFSIQSINMTAGTTSEDLSDDEKIMMIYYVLILFLWYGGIIFVCLIGFGVYKTPRSKQIYRNFVERQELRETLKQKKLDEIKMRKMERQNSVISSIMSNANDSAKGSIELSLSWPNANGNMLRRSSSGDRGFSKGYSSSLQMSSAVYQEDERLLKEETNHTADQKVELRVNGRAVFEV